MSRDFDIDVNSSRRCQSRVPDQAIAEIAGRQHRVVHRRQLLGLTLSPAQITYRLRVGRLYEVLPGVYAVGVRKLTREGRLVAAALWAGADAVISDRSAAGLWQLLSPGETTHVSCARTPRPRRGIALHRRRLPPDEITTLDGIPVTTVARTLLDIAATEGRPAFERALRQADFHELTDATPLPTLIARYPGGRGTAVARAVLATRRPTGHTESELEDRFAAFLVDRGFPPPRLNADVCVDGRWFRVDCLWEDEGVVVELDGRRAHSGHRADADAERDMILASVGLLTVRVGWGRLHDDPDGLEANLRALLAGRRARAA